MKNSNIEVLGHDVISRNGNPIYVITSFQKDGRTEDRFGYPNYGLTRVVGFFHSFNEAEQVVINNRCDLCEDGYYPYAVIEAVTPGLYPDNIGQEEANIHYYKYVGGNQYALTQDLLMGRDTDFLVESWAMG